MGSRGVGSHSTEQGSCVHRGFQKTTHSTRPDAQPTPRAQGSGKRGSLLLGERHSSEGRKEKPDWGTREKNMPALTTATPTSHLVMKTTHRQQDVTTNREPRARKRKTTVQNHL